jgi:hypothetical protein
VSKAAIHRYKDEKAQAVKTVIYVNLLLHKKEQYKSGKTGQNDHSTNEANSNAEYPLVVFEITFLLKVEDRSVPAILTFGIEIKRDGFIFLEGNVESEMQRINWSL